MADVGDRIFSGERLGKAVAVWLAKAFGPLDFVLEPCAGGNDIYRHLPEPKDWCELTRGRDFLAYGGPRVPWIVTNPPWSEGGDNTYNDIFKHCLKWGDNILFVVPIRVALAFTARNLLWRDAGFGLHTIIMIASRQRMKGRPDAITPDGFNAGGNQQSVVVWRRGYRGQTRILWWD